MIYTIIFQDSKFFNEQKNALLKKKHITYTHVVDDILHVPLLLELFGQQSFFGTPTYAIIIKYIFSEISYEEWEELFKILIAQGHLIILGENAQSSNLLKITEAYSGVVISEKEKITKKNEVNMFKLTDHVLDQHKKDAWLELQYLKSQGVETAEIFRVLLWACKSLILVANTQNSSETQMKPFVYNKMKQRLPLWKSTQLRDYTKKLIDISILLDEKESFLALEQHILAI